MRITRGGRELAPGENIGDLLTWNGSAWVASPPAAQNPSFPIVEGDTIIYQTINNILTPIPASQIPSPAGSHNMYEVESFLGTPTGTLITAWPDVSGNGFDISNAGGAARPTYLVDPLGDGINLVRFDGVANFLRRLAMAAVASSEMTVFTVFSQIGPAASEPWGLGSAASVSDSAAGHARGTIGAASFTSGAQANNLGGATAIGPGATALDSASTVNQAGTNVRRAMAWKWTTRSGRWSVFPFLGNSVSEAFLTAAPPATGFTWTAVILGAGNNAGGAPNLFCRADWCFFSTYPGVILSDRVIRVELEKLRARYQCL
jgi:hypothetical protein